MKTQRNNAKAYRLLGQSKSTAQSRHLVCPALSNRSVLNYLAEELVSGLHLPVAGRLDAFGEQVEAGEKRH